MGGEINYYCKKEDLDIVKKIVVGIIEELIRRFEERKMVMENVLIGIDWILEKFD